MEISAQSIRIQWCSEVLILPAVLSMEDSARKELKDSVHAHRNNMGEWYLLKVVWQSVTSHEQHLWPGAIPDYTHQTRPPPTHLILLVLSRVWECWNDSRNSASWGYLAGVYHDEQFHKHIIHLATTTLHNVYILTAYRLPNLHTATRKRLTPVWRITHPQNNHMVLDYPTLWKEHCQMK